MMITDGDIALLRGGVVVAAVLATGVLVVRSCAPPGWSDAAPDASAGAAAGVVGVAGSVSWVVPPPGPEESWSSSTAVVMPDGSVRVWTSDGAVRFRDSTVHCYGPGSVTIGGHDVCAEAR